MKINYQHISAIAVFLFFAGATLAQPIIFNDAIFKQELISLGVDTSGNGEIEIQEAHLITTITLDNKGITDLTGLEHFINLESLQLKDNAFSTIPLTTLTKLTFLRFDNNSVGEVNLSTLLDLEFLYCPYNDLTELDISNNTKLIVVKAYDNDISTLNVTGLTSLEALFLSNNNLATVDISTLSALEQIQLKANGLTEIDFSNNTTLTLIYVQVNELTTLNVSNQVGLTALRVQLNSGLEEVCVPDKDAAEASGDFVKDSATAWIECVVNDIEPSMSLNEWSISPNPTSNRVSIAGNVAEVLVFDALGNELLSSAKSIVDLSDQKSGVYFLRVRYANGETHVERILKQ